VKVKAAHTVAKIAKRKSRQRERIDRSAMGGVALDWGDRQHSAPSDGSPTAAVYHHEQIIATSWPVAQGYWIDALVDGWPGIKRPPPRFPAQRIVSRQGDAAVVLI
jgi:hypothetical protein